MPRELLTKKIPRTALQFAAEITPGETTADAGGPTLFRFSMLARTPGVANHPYWGRCIHDFAGMQQLKSSITIDFCHNPADVVGFADQVTVNEAGLQLAGALVSTRADDRAAEIAGKQKAGVPYEASIQTSWQDLLIEDVPAGYTADVNGITVEGPITIFRQWQLWGCAVCPYGADANTSIQFAGGAPAEVEVSLFQEVLPMSTATPPVAAPVVAKTGKDFMTRFGAAKGSLWFAEGKSWDEALAQFDADMAEDSKKKDEEITTLKASLSALQAKYDALVEETKKPEEDAGQNAGVTRGETPVSGNIAAGAPAAGKFTNLPDGMSKFAASIVLPGQTAAK